MKILKALLEILDESFWRSIELNSKLGELTNKSNIEYFLIIVDQIILFITLQIVKFILEGRNNFLASFREILINDGYQTSIWRQKLQIRWVIFRSGENQLGYPLSRYFVHLTIVILNKFFSSTINLVFWLALWHFPDEFIKLVIFPLIDASGLSLLSDLLFQLCLIRERIWLLAILFLFFLNLLQLFDFDCHQLFALEFLSLQELLSFRFRNDVLRVVR